MKVILLKDIAKMGKRGEVLDVSDSYAVNVLIPKQMVLQATAGELAKWKQKEEAKKFKKNLETNTFLQLVQKIRNTTIAITGKKADAKGQLFASIHENDITDALYKAIGLSIDPKQIHIDGHIKTLGTHKVTVKQGTEKETFSITVK